MLGTRDSRTRERSCRYQLDRLAQVKLGTSILSVVLAVAACKDKDQTATKARIEPPTGPTATTPRRVPAIPLAPRPTKPGVVGPRVTIAPMKLDFTGKDLAIDADGNLTAGGKVRGKITADGKMLGPDGSVLLGIEDDGTVKFAQASDSQKVVVIDADGGVTVDGEPTMRIDDDGKIYSRRKPGGPLEDEGMALFEGPPETRRMAALVIVATMIGRPGGAPPSTGVVKSEVR